MPIYEYICKDCGAKFEAIRSMKDADAPIICKKCLSTQTQRAISMCYASSEGRSLTSSSGGCSGCSGGSCSSCGH